MTPEKVTELLENYRENRARLAHLRQEAEELQTALEAEKRRSIESDSIHAQQYSGMPHSGVISQQVQDLAIRYVDGYQSPMVKDWTQQLESMLQDIAIVERSVRYVDNWFSSLDEKERTVLTMHHPIGDMSWRDMAASSPKLFGYHMSESGLQKIAKAAKAKIIRIAC